MDPPPTVTTVLDGSSCQHQVLVSTEQFQCFANASTSDFALEGSWGVKGVWPRLYGPW